MKELVSLCITVTSLLAVSGCTITKQGYVAKGNKLFEAGKYADASLNYRKAIQKDPQFGEAYYRLGLSAIKQDDGRQAFAALVRAVELLPDNVDAKEKFADLCLTNYLVDPNRPKSLYDRVTTLSDDLLKKNANSFQGLRLKGYLASTDRKPKEAIAFFSKAIQVKPTDPILTTALVQSLFQDGQAQEAERVALDLIARQKTYGLIYDGLYTWYFNAKRMAEAENILKTKVNNNPKQADFILDLAMHYVRVQKPQEMNSTLKRLLDDPQDFPQARLRVGDFFFRLGDSQEAMRNYQEGARTNPQDKVVYEKKITNTLMAQGKRDEASIVIEQILKALPNDDETLSLRATLWLENGKPEKVDLALPEFQALLKRHPGDSSLVLRLGQAYRLKGDLEAARTQFLEIRSGKEFLPARYELAELSQTLERPRETVQFASDVLAAKPNDAKGRVLHAAGLMGTGSQAAARTELTQVIKEYPRYLDAQLQLGFLALNEKKYQEAVSIFEKLHSSSEDPRLIVGLGAAYSGQNQNGKAIQLLRDALKKSPESSLIRGQLANVAVIGGQYDLAIAELQKLLSSDPKSSRQRLRLGEVYGLKGDYNNAIAMYQQAQELSPNDPVSTIILAIALTNSGRTNEAVAQYQKLLLSNPDNTTALNNLAFLLSETGGNLDEALRLAQRAIEKNPGEPSFNDTIGWIYLKKGMRDSAVQVFGNLVRKYPNYPTFRYHLAMALLEKGDKTGARRELETALASHPSKTEEVKIKELVSKIG